MVFGRPGSITLNYWRSKGVPEDVAKSLGAWAPKSDVPAKHYLRTHLIDSVLTAAVGSQGSGRGRHPSSGAK